MGDVVDDSHLAAANVLCKLPDSPMPKQYISHIASPLGASPFSMFKAGLSPMTSLKGIQSRDGAGSLANSPAQIHTGNLDGKLTPCMYTLDPDSSSIPGMGGVSPWFNNASNLSHASLASGSSFRASKNPSFVQRLQFDEEDSVPFASLTGQAANSTCSITSTGRSRMTIWNGTVTKRPDVVPNTGRPPLPPNNNTSTRTGLRSNTMKTRSSVRSSFGQITGKGLENKINRPLGKDPTFTQDGKNCISPTPPKTKQKKQIGHNAPFSTPASQRAVRGRVHATAMTPSTPSEGKQLNPCNCKKSKCLKLYCECFAAGAYCVDCNCNNCANTSQSESLRQEAIKATLERNPNAFKPKFNAGPSPAGVIQSGIHTKGCHCKKSGCLKKYCECFQANVYCGQNCKCQSCKNFEGSTALSEKTLGKRLRTLDTPSVEGSSKKMKLQSGRASTTMKQQNSTKLTNETLSSKRSLVTNSRTSKTSLNATLTDNDIKPENIQQSTVTTAGLNATTNAPEHEIEVQAFGNSNAKLDKRLVVSILTYLDNSDLFNASLVSKTLGPIAVGDSLWEFPESG